MKKLLLLSLGALAFAALPACSTDQPHTMQTTTTEETVVHQPVVAPVTTQTQTVRTY